MRGDASRAASFTPGARLCARHGTYAALLAIPGTYGLPASFVAYNGVTGVCGQSLDTETSEGP